MALRVSVLQYIETNNHVYRSFASFYRSIVSLLQDKRFILACFWPYYVCSGVYVRHAMTIKESDEKEEHG